MFEGLTTEAYDRQYSDKELLKRVGSYFWKYKRLMVWVAVLTTLVSLLTALQPIVFAQVIGGILEPDAPWSFLLALAAGVAAIGFLVWVVQLFQQRITARIVADVVSTLRNDSFKAAIQHDMSFFDEYKSGRIISRITSDTQEFAQVSRLVLQVLSQIMTVVILLVYLFNTSWKLTLGMIAFTPLVILVALMFRRLARFVTRKGFQVIANVNSAIQESITGVSVAKNFRQEARIYDEFLDINDQSYGVNLRRGFVLANVFPTLNILSGFGTAALVYWGGLSVLDAAITLASWYVFVRAVDLFWFPVLNISAFWSQFQAGLSAAERIFGLIDADPTVQQTAAKKINVQGRVDFDHVDFAYKPGEPVLQNFTLHIAPGESVALVGHTGAGKSSIAKLIARFYEFQGGSINIDGVDIRELDLEHFRSQLGIVSQTPFLFAGTIADNIRYAAPDLTDAEIETFARDIGKGEWLETMPQGIYTEVGERGSRLSLGQRQLVALTRVIASKPSIFVLDEATASIDPFTETQIQAATDLILSQSTSILIAHRLSTVRSAHRIIVLEHGHIIESGSHEELMQQGGHYAELYETYFRHQSLDYIEERGLRRQRQPA